MRMIKIIANVNFVKNLDYAQFLANCQVFLTESSLSRLFYDDQNHYLFFRIKPNVKKIFEHLLEYSLQNTFVNSYDKRLPKSNTYELNCLFSLFLLIFDDHGIDIFLFQINMSKGLDRVVKQVIFRQKENPTK